MVTHNLENAWAVAQVGSFAWFIPALSARLDDEGDRGGLPEVMLRVTDKRCPIGIVGGLGSRFDHDKPVIMTVGWLEDLIRAKFIITEIFVGEGDATSALVSLRLISSGIVQRMETLRAIA